MASHAVVIFAGGLWKEKSGYGSGAGCYYGVVSIDMLCYAMR